MFTLLLCSHLLPLVRPHFFTHILPQATIHNHIRLRAPARRILARSGVQRDNYRRRHVQVNERAEHDLELAVRNNVDVHEWTMQLTREQGYVN